MPVIRLFKRARGRHPRPIDGGLLPHSQRRDQADRQPDRVKDDSPFVRLVLPCGWNRGRCVALPLYR